MGTFPGSHTELSKEDLADLLARAIDLIPAEVFLLDAADGDLLLANAAARKRLQDGTPLGTVLARVAFRQGGGRVFRSQQTLAKGEVLWVLHDADSSRRREESAACAGRIWGLTERQTAVLSLLLDGLSNGEIARRLGCARNTVELHMSAVLSKSGSRTRAEAVSRAFEVAAWPVTRQRANEPA